MENFKKKNEQYKKRIARFSLQFLTPKRLLFRPLFGDYFMMLK